MGGEWIVRRESKWAGEWKWERSDYIDGELDRRGNGNGKGESIVSGKYVRGGMEIGRG